MMGTGTLANDAVAAQIESWKSPGLVLSNGAFGERLVDHAKRFRLPFRVMKADWGKAFDPRSLREALRVEPTEWIWAVHGETSTGVLNDLDVLKSAAREVGAKVCLDAVSSVGVAPIDLTSVALASSVSGKGLASFPGLAFVFHNAPIVPLRHCPRVLDLGHYSEQNGVPFTISSNLVSALKTALEGVNIERRLARVERLAVQLRNGLSELGLSPIADPANFAAVTTVAVPGHLRSLDFGRELESLGCLVHFRSAYLPARNWIQFCLMGRTSTLRIDRAIGCLRRVLGR
jgi:aspartate aminotransferase-like enzyme